MTGKRIEAVLRSEVEKALDEIISNEEGMTFQGLAVVLAKKRWPDLIASERKKDFGLDAYASASLAADGVGKGLACSITAEIEKISADARKVKQRFPDVTVLLFATPQKVSNPKKDEWAGKIKKDFGYELQVVSREDIIASLMQPENASLCSSFLGIDLSVDEPLKDIVESVRRAAAADSSTWTAKTPGPLINLLAAQIDDAGNDLSSVYSLTNLHEALSESRRIVLEAPAGRGKTTTLAQLSEIYTRLNGTAFLVDLPAWVSSRVPILDFIARSPQFQARGLDAATLAQIRGAEEFAFLLNGWNEITESDSIEAAIALRCLERSFPEAGIIVATRTHHVRPPLPGAVKFRLLPLTRAQRREYLVGRLHDRASALNTQLNADVVLDDITRTPLILSGVTSLFEAGAAIPKTKIGVLGAVIRLLEESPEHNAHLRSAPLIGLHGDYLGELAARMTAAGSVTLAEIDARAIVHVVAGRLRNGHQVTLLPEPAEVLATLCAHHVLERLEYPEVAFRFEHQQFQEHYAAMHIKRQLVELAARNRDDERRNFTATYVNAPAWTEPLRMIAETIGAQSTDEIPDQTQVAAGRSLVEMALSVDLVFAAELSRLCGPFVWSMVGLSVSIRLRSWFAVRDEHHRHCALAGMLATGSNEFQDIIVPFLSGADKQLRLQTYRFRPELHLTSLGPNWPEVAGSWNEEARTTFVSEILHNRFVPEVVAFAAGDKSPAVQRAALDGLTWNRLDDEAERFIESLAPTIYDSIAKEIAPDLVPRAERARVVTTLRNVSEATSDPAERLTTLLKIVELSDANLDKELKATLNALPEKIAENWMQHSIRQALEIVRPRDSVWVSEWVATRVTNGSLWAEHWMPFVSKVPSELLETSLRRLETEDLKNLYFGGLVAVIAAGADATISARVFSDLRAHRQTITTAPDEKHELEWAIERQLEGLFHALPREVSVRGVFSALPGHHEMIDLEVVSRLFGRVARTESESLASIESSLKAALREYLKQRVKLVVEQHDYDGELKANFASVLAQVGEAGDIEDLRILIRADIDRVRRGRAARAAGDRGPRGNGASTTYASWHVRSIIELNSPNTDAVLLDLLQEPEYEWAVAEELPRLVLPPRTDAPLWNKVDYEKIWQARAGRPTSSSNDGRRARFAVALRGHIARLLEERRNSPHPEWYAHRLGELGKAIALLDGARFSDVVFEVMSLPERGSGWQQVSALESVLFAGGTLSAQPTLAIFDAVLEQAQRYGVQDNERWLINRFLCICPYIDPPAAGMQKIRDVVRQRWVHPYELREVATAVGRSRCDEALGLLRELASDPIRAKEMGEAWINAVAALDTHSGRCLLMSFVDPEREGIPNGIHLGRDDSLAARIVDATRRDPALELRLRELCAMDLPSVHRLLLAKVMNFLGTPDALAAALNLINDNAQPAIIYDTWEQLETAFVERKPYGQNQNTYTLAARASNEIRCRLFEMAVRDYRRKRSAYSLVGQIEEWRLEYGRPFGEPRHPAFGSTDPWPPLEPQN